MAEKLINVNYLEPRQVTDSIESQADVSRFNLEALQRQYEDNLRLIGAQALNQSEVDLTA